MKGNTGKILHVDLTTGTFTVETPDEKFYRTYVGGSCMGVYYVTRLTPVGADPLGPENVLAFTTSAVVGAPLSGNARHCVSAKSPLTGGIMSSEGGGYWGPELRFAGFDAVVIRGKAPKPTYLVDPRRAGRVARRRRAVGEGDRRRPGRPPAGVG